MQRVEIVTLYWPKSLKPGVFACWTFITFHDCLERYVDILLCF